MKKFFWICLLLIIGGLDCKYASLLLNALISQLRSGSVNLDELNWRKTQYQVDFVFHKLGETGSLFLKALKEVKIKLKDIIEISLHF